MTADTDPRCPLCGAMLQPMVEHYCKIDSDSIDAPIVVAVCERLPAAGWLPPADAARLRALLRELVEGQNRPGHWCTYCGEYQAGTYSSHDGHGVIIKHTDDCPVARARAEVGGGE